MAYYDTSDPWSRNYRKPSKWKRFLRSIKPSWWDNFWYNYHSNGIIGPGYNCWKEFKTSNLALVIALLTLIIVISYILIHG